MRFSILATGMLVALGATPALAQDATDPPPPITVTGSVGIVSDYRFRGVSQSDKEIALQGGFTLNTDYGLYASIWGSNLAGWGTFGGANLELDVIAGYKAKIGEGGTVDVGVTWYTYPGGADQTDFFEPYVKVGGTVGPASLTASVFYAPKQRALGLFTRSLVPLIPGPGTSEDNLYLAGDAAVGVPQTPVTLKGHIGYSDGNPGLGPNGTSVAPTGKYWDWSVGADVVYKNLTLNVSYIDTDISNRETAYLQPNLAKTTGGSIVGSTVVVGVTAGF